MLGPEERPFTIPICNEFVFLLRITTTDIPAGRQHTVKAKTMRAAHERMRVKQGSFLASPAWPQPRLPLGQSCYASLPFKQMRKCSSSLPNDLFGSEPRQVSFQSMRPRMPLTQPLLTLCHPARLSRATRVQGTKVFFQIPQPPATPLRNSHVAPKYPNPFNNLLTKICPSAHVPNTPMLGWGGVIDPGGLCCEGQIVFLLAGSPVCLTKQVLGSW